MPVEFSKISFTGSDVIKFVGAGVMLSTMYVNLATKLEEHKATHTIIEYRLAALEGGIASNKEANNKLLVNLMNSYPIRPKDIKIEQEDNNKK